MKKLVGVFATIALLGSGAALANDDKNKPQQDPAAAQGGSGQAGSSGMAQDPAMQEPASQDPAMQEPASQEPAMGGSGTTMGSQSAMGQKEVTGKVVKADRNTVWIDMQGAVVPLKVNKSTQFMDPNVKRARDLQPGQEIRASLEVKETDNVAKSISMTGTGGAGEMMPPDSTMEPGTGGSGMEHDKSMEPGTGGSGTGMEEDKSMEPGTGGSGDVMQPDSSINEGGTGGSGDTGTMNPDTGSDTR